MSDAMRAETIMITGYGGDQIEAYLGVPLESGPHGGIVVIHHMPGYDSATKAMVRNFAAAGYAAICPNLHYREAAGADPAQAAAAVRQAGGVPDERLIGDVEGAATQLKSLASANGKLGVIGHCSGGRQAFLAACSLRFAAAVDCYGAFVVNEPPAGMPLAMKPVVGLAPELSCPLLGIFGIEDANPAPEETATLSAALDQLGKQHEFHTYDGAGHAFMAVDRPNYRPQAAVEAWERIFEFFARHLDHTRQV